MSKLLGVDVRGFKHSISNQAVAHIKLRHPNVTLSDMKLLPVIVKTATPALAKDRGINGVPRVIYRAQIEGVKYEYLAEVRRRKKRLDAITFYRV